MASSIAELGKTPKMNLGWQEGRLSIFRLAAIFSMLPKKIKDQRMCVLVSRHKLKPIS